MFLPRSAKHFSVLALTNWCSADSPAASAVVTEEKGDSVLHFGLIRIGKCHVQLSGKNRRSNLQHIFVAVFLL